MLQRAGTQRFPVFANTPILYLHPIQYRLPTRLRNGQLMCGSMRAKSSLRRYKPNKGEHEYNHHNVCNSNGRSGSLHRIRRQCDLHRVWWRVSCHYHRCVGFEQRVGIWKLCCFSAGYQCWRNLWSRDHRLRNILRLHHHALRAFIKDPGIGSGAGISSLQRALLSRQLRTLGTVLVLREVARRHRQKPAAFLGA
jgi:hypothetical protein